MDYKSTQNRVELVLRLIYFCDSFYEGQLRSKERHIAKISLIIDN